MSISYTVNDDSVVIKEEIEIEETQLQEQIWNGLKTDTHNEVENTSECFKIKTEPDLNNEAGLNNINYANVVGEIEGSGISTNSCVKYKHCCPHCPFSCKQKRLWKLHLRKAHLTKNAFKFECPQCHKKDFNSVKAVRIHRRKTHRDFLQSCLVCGKAMKSKLAFKYHMKSHTEKVCQVCNRVVSDSKALIDHVKNEHIGKVKLVCPICSKISDRPHLHKIHINLCTGDRPYKCTKCPKDFHGPTDLKRHLKTHFLVPETNQELICSICQKTFSSKKSLNTHINAHNQITPYKCDQCSEQYASSSGLANHLRKHFINPKDDDRVQKCPLCPKYYISKRAMEGHMNFHKGERSFKCEICPWSFYDLYSFNRHKQTHQIEQKFECRICDAKFNVIARRRVHEKKHLLVRSRQCKICEMYFWTESQLHGHTANNKCNPDLIEEEVRTHPKNNCSFCTRTFRHKYNLEEHMNMHLGKRPYKCENCSKAFFSHLSLIGHRNIHKRIDRNLECSVCNKKFTSFIRRREHEESHLKEQPFQCTGCRMYFQLLRQLDRHLKLNKCSREKANELQPKKSNDGQRDNVIEIIQCEDERNQEVFLIRNSS